MSMEPELEILRAAWTASPGSETNVSRAGWRGRERSLRVQYVLELVFAAALIGFAVVFVRRHFDWEALVWAAVVCFTTIGAAAFQIWNWRSLWRSSGQSLADYAEAYERRCRATLRAVRFGYRFLALQLAISTPWLTIDFLRGEITPSRYAFSMGVLALLTITYLFAFRQMRRRAMRELAAVGDFRRESSGA